MNKKRGQSKIVDAILIVILIIAVLIIIWQILLAYGSRVPIRNRPSPCIGVQIDIIKAIANNSVDSKGIVIAQRSSSENSYDVFGVLYINGSMTNYTTEKLDPMQTATLYPSSNDLHKGDIVKVVTFVSNKKEKVACPIAVQYTAE
jgi:hypothetical protein